LFLRNKNNLKIPLDDVGIEIYNFLGDRASAIFTHLATKAAHRSGFFHIHRSAVMERITIEVADDGRVSVMAESPDEEMETMEFDNVEDAMQAVKGLIMDQEMDEEMETDEETMWNEEAAKRPTNPNMMR
jgi:hypothetical protein